MLIYKFIEDSSWFKARQTRSTLFSIIIWSEIPGLSTRLKEFREVQLSKKKKKKKLFWKCIVWLFHLSLCVGDIYLKWRHHELSFFYSLFASAWSPNGPAHQWSEINEFNGSKASQVTMALINFDGWYGKREITIFACLGSSLSSTHKARV